MLIVSHRRAQVTVVSRQGGTWRAREYRAGETVELSVPSVTFEVDELYAGIELDAG